MSNTHTANETLFDRKPFDFVPIDPSVPANNLKEFIAHAKSKPGQLN